MEEKRFMAECVTSGSAPGEVLVLARGGERNIVLDVCESPHYRPTQLANNHAWHNQINRFAAARGGADETTDRRDARKAVRKGVEATARWTTY